MRICTRLIGYIVQFPFTKWLLYWPSSMSVSVTQYTALQSVPSSPTAAKQIDSSTTTTSCSGWLAHERYSATRGTITIDHWRSSEHHVE